MQKVAKFGIRYRELNHPNTIRLIGLRMTFYHPNCFLNLSRPAIQISCQIFSSMEFLGNIRSSFLLNAHPLTKTMSGIFKSELFDFELTFILGTATTGGCDIAEFFEAVGKIKKHNPESWYSAW
jgi:hypothetical protein